MTERKHVNLFVTDSARGSIFSSVIHTWAKDRFDSVTVLYTEQEELPDELHSLAKHIRLADQCGANPCSKRLVVVIGMVIPKEIEDALLELDGVYIDQYAPSFIDYDRWMWRTIEHYFGHRKKEWPYGYQALYRAMKNASCAFFEELVWLHSCLGGQELELLITAYTHDLMPPASFSPWEMRDYYFEVFKQKQKEEPNVPNPAECL